MIRQLILHIIILIFCSKELSAQDKFWKKLEYEYRTSVGVVYTSTKNPSTSFTNYLIDFNKDNYNFVSNSMSIFYKNIGLSFNYQISDFSFNVKNESPSPFNYLWQRFDGTFELYSYPHLIENPIIGDKRQQDRLLLGLIYKIPINKLNIQAGISVGRFTQMYKRNFQYHMTQIGTGQLYNYSIQSNTFGHGKFDLVKSYIFHSSLIASYKVFDDIYIFLDATYFRYNLNTTYREEILNFSTLEYTESYIHFDKPIHNLGLGLGIKFVFY